ncbi:MAG: hypothetical protein PWP11_3099 [Thauera sp.]|nr:hypothetical protein [Thauera sp.]
MSVQINPPELVGDPKDCVLLSDVSKLFGA